MQRARFTMSLDLFGNGKETQTELTDIETFQIVIINRVRTVIPSFTHMASHLNASHRFELGVFLMSQQLSIVHPQMRVVVWMQIVVSTNILWRTILNFLYCFSYSIKWYPFIIPSVQRLEMDVVFVRFIRFLLCCIIIYNMIRKMKEIMQNALREMVYL